MKFRPGFVANSSTGDYVAVGSNNMEYWDESADLTEEDLEFIEDFTIQDRLRQTLKASNQQEFDFLINELRKFVK